jgi:hypothetical protein
MTSLAQTPADTRSKELIHETCSDILNQKLPDLLFTKGLTTVGSSLHSISFVGKLGRWEDFPEEVLLFSKASDRELSSTVASFRRHPPAPHDLHNELVYCGDELSVSGRFTQNVLHPVTSAACVMNNPTRFGDFKICQEAHKAVSVVPALKDTTSSNGKPGLKIPDLVAVNKEDSKLRFLGEAKTPWNHKPHLYLRNYTKGNKGYLEKALGKSSSSPKLNILYTHTYLLDRASCGLYVCLRYEICLLHDI